VLLQVIFSTYPVLSSTVIQSFIENGLSIFTKIPLIKSDKLDCRERAMAAKTIPPAASILVSSKLKTKDKTRNEGIANNKN
jgi:hypothetical protein